MKTTKQAATVAHPYHADTGLLVYTPNRAMAFGKEHGAAKFFFNLVPEAVKTAFDQMVSPLLARYGAERRRV